MFKMKLMLVHTEVITSMIQRILLIIQVLVNGPIKPVLKWDGFKQPLRIRISRCDQHKSI